MLRAWSLLLLLAGCDEVFGLDRIGHDEDEDGAPDDEDTCPHIPGAAQTDSDGDGIGDACDPSSEQEAATFFTFRDSFAGLQVNGPVMLDGDDLIFGATDDTKITLLLAGPDGLPVEVEAGWVQVGFTMIDPEPDGTYHEMGIVFGHVSTITDEDRGNLCLAGYEPGMARDLVSFLQMDENTTRKSFKTSSVPLRNNRATLSASWVGTDTKCALTATGIGLDDHYDPTLPSGRLGLYQQRLRTRLHYLWIVTRP